MPRTRYRHYASLDAVARRGQRGSKSKFCIGVKSSPASFCFCLASPGTRTATTRGVCLRYLYGVLCFLASLPPSSQLLFVFVYVIGKISTPGHIKQHLGWLELRSRVDVSAGRLQCTYTLYKTVAQGSRGGFGLGIVLKSGSCPLPFPRECIGAAC